MEVIKEQLKRNDLMNLATISRSQQHQLLSKVFMNPSITSSSKQDQFLNKAYILPATIQATIPGTRTR
eukprot:12719650-Prorocentrum_lima.AAC.1